MVFNVGRIISGGLKLLSYGPIQSVAAVAGSPVLVSFKKQYDENPEEFRKNFLNKEKNPWQRFKESFSYGDIASVMGLVGCILSGKFLKAELNEEEQGQLTGVKLWAKRAVQLLTIAGFGLSRLAQIQNWHIRKALGVKEYRKVFIKAIENKIGKSVFATIENNYLIGLTSIPNEYNEEEEEITTLYNLNSFKKFYTGGPGVGKSTGVEQICGRYIDRKQGEDSTSLVSVKRFNFKNLFEILGSQSQTFDIAGTFTDMFGSEHGKGIVEQARSVGEINPVELMEIALGLIDDEVKESKSKGEDLILILDEVDAIFQVDKIQSGQVDPTKFRMVVEMLKDLFDSDELPDRVLSTSNLDIDFFNKLPLEQSVKDSLTGPGGRVSSTRREIKRPKPATQSKIIANKLLARYPNPEEVFSQEIINKIDPSKNTIKQQRAMLARLINLEITGNHSCEGMVGRDINQAIEGIHAKYLEEKSKLDKEDVRIDIEMIKKVLHNLKENIHRGTSGAQNDEVSERVIESLVSMNAENLENLKLLASNYATIESPENLSLDSLLGKLFNGIYVKSETPSGYYLLPQESDVNKLPVIDGMRYLNCLRLKKPKEDLENLNKWTVEVCFRALNGNEGQGKTVQDLIESSLHDFERSSAISGKDFYVKFTEKLLFAIEKISHGGSTSEVGGVNLSALFKSALDIAGKLGFKGLGS